jgi:hypothetical protein
MSNPLIGPTTADVHTVPRVLLTVSGVIPDDLEDQIAHGRRPRADYVELARAMDATLLDVVSARDRSGMLGKLLERLGGSGLLLAWVCFREGRRYDTIVTDGEQVGLWLALIWAVTTRRRPCRHVMIAHILSVPKKVALFRAFRLGRHIDRIIVYSSWQRRFIERDLCFPPDRIELTSFMVDTRFFAPAPRRMGVRPMICTAGLERRDYPTLIEAVRGMDVDVIIGAASPWSRRADTTRGEQLPDNVEVCALDFADLRTLYARASFVVVPLYDVEFQAGVTTILEAMAMGRAVVCTRTRGQTDVVVSGHTGCYVPPADVAALRSAITSLLDDPEEADRLGRAARAYVVEHCDIDVYARHLAHLVGPPARTAA